MKFEWTFSDFYWSGDPNLPPKKHGTVMDNNADIAINLNNMGVEWRCKKFKTDNVTTK